MDSEYKDEIQKAIAEGNRLWASSSANRLMQERASATARSLQISQISANIPDWIQKAAADGKKSLLVGTTVVITESWLNNCTISNFCRLAVPAETNVYLLDQVVGSMNRHVKLCDEVVRFRRELMDAGLIVRIYGFDESKGIFGDVEPNAMIRYEMYILWD